VEITGRWVRADDSRAYEWVQLHRSDQQKRVGDLPAASANRVHLAKVLKEGANVLLLDEPTNDLDVNTLRALEEALDDSPAAPSSSAMIAGSTASADIMRSRGWGVRCFVAIARLRGGSRKRLALPRRRRTGSCTAADALT